MYGPVTTTGGFYEFGVKIITFWEVFIKGFKQRYRGFFLEKLVVVQ